MKKKQDINHSLWLRQEFDKRRKRNPSYSLRSFARSLGASPASVSQILQGNSNLGIRLARKIATRLGMSVTEREHFLGPFSVRGSTKPYQTINTDQFSMIADWFHYGILGLGGLKHSSKEPTWIADKLGITIRQAKSAVKRLTKLNLIDPQSEKIKQTGESLKTDEDFPNEAIQTFHTQLLEKAKNSLLSEHVDDRDFSASLISIRKEDLPEFKAEIRRFRDRICDLSDRSKDHDQVYAMTIQLFSLLSRKDSK